MAQPIKVLSLRKLQIVLLPPMPYDLYTETLDWGFKLISRIDGADIRGVSTLLILEAIMENLGEAGGLEEIPRPCDYFDLIGGTSTGGPVDFVGCDKTIRGLHCRSIIAIMLDRLRMSVDECLRVYKP